MIRTVSITETRHNLQDAKKDDKIIHGKIVGVVALTLFCDYFLLTLVIPIFPELFGDSFSSFQIGILFAAKPLFQFFFNPLIGAQVDKVGPVYPLLFGTLVLALATIVMTLGAALKNTPNLAYTLVVMARSIQGISSSSTMSAGMALMSTTHAESLQGTVMGVAMCGVAFGNLLGPPLGGVLGYYLNLWAPFLLVSLILLLDIGLQTVYVFLPHRERERHKKDNLANNNTLLMPLMLESSMLGSASSKAETDAEKEKAMLPEVSPFTTMWQLLQRVDILTVVVAAIVSNSSIGVIEPLVPRWLDEEFDQNIMWQGLIFGFTTLAYLLATPLAGVLSDYVPIWSCMVFGFGCMGAGLVLFSLAESIAFACLCLFLVGVGMGFVDIPILPLLADIVMDLSPADEAALSLSSQEQEQGGGEDGVGTVATTTERSQGEGTAGTGAGVGSMAGSVHTSLDEEALGQEPGGSSAETKQLLGVTYAMNDMCFSIGFFLGPLVGTGVETAFGDGQTGFRRTMLSVGVLCFVMIPVVFYNLGFRKSNRNTNN